MVYLNSKFFGVAARGSIVAGIGQPDQSADALSARDLDLLFDWGQSFVITGGVAGGDRLHRCLEAPARILQQVAAWVIQRLLLYCSIGQRCASRVDSF